MRQLVWLLPFLSFLGGYYVLKNVCVVTELATPSLIGLPLYQAVSTLSDLSLNPRITAHQEELDVPSGTILSQNPLPGQKVKPHQSIFLVISKTPEKQKMPLVVGKQEEEVEKELQSLHIPYKKYMIPSRSSRNSCFAQYPIADAEIEHSATVYCSAGDQKQLIVPNFKNLPVAHILNFLQKQSLAYQVVHTYPQPLGHHCQECIVIDQRPLAGSLVDIDAHSKLVVQLKVSSSYL